MGLARAAGYHGGMDDERLARISNLMEKLGLAQKHLGEWLDEKAKAGTPLSSDEQENLNKIQTDMRESLARLSRMIDGYAANS